MRAVILFFVLIPLGIFGLNGCSGDKSSGLDVVDVETIPTEGLIAYYPFTGNANDESGNGYHGSVNGATLTADRFGAVRKAYSFATNSYISSSPTLPIGRQARTMSAWFSTTSASGSNGWNVNTIVSWGSPSLDALCAVGVYKSKLMFGAFGTTYDVYTAAIVNDGNWHHAVVTYDSLVLSIYLDDSLLVSESRNLGTINSPFYIGRRASQDNQFMNGLIDDIRLYDRALSETEIRALYNEGR
jgi:hypothetical protein